MSRFRSLCVLAALLLTFGVPAPGVAETGCDSSVDPSSGSLGDLLLSVTGPPEDAVAVGVHFVGGDGSPFLAVREGDSWRPIHVPTQAGARTIELQDAFADGRSVWAVGAFRNDRPQAGLFRDGRWLWTRPVDPGEGEDEFLGVAAARDGTVWAVGKHQVGANYQPLIERYDGHAWTVVPVPHVRGSAVLKDVTAGPNGRLYTVGWRVQRGGRTIPLVMATFGDRWIDQAVEGRGLLSGVAVPPDEEPIAVGWEATEHGDQAITFHRTTSGWRPLNGTGSQGRLAAVTSGEATIAVGTRFEDGVPVPTVVRLSPEGWVPLDVNGEAAPEAGGDQLLGVTGEAGSFFAVGIRDVTDAFASLVVTGDCVG